MSDDDPFEALDEEVEDREGDPFERLAGDVDDEEEPPEESLDEFGPAEEGEQSDWIDEYGVSDDPQPESRDPTPDEPDDSSEMSFDVGVRDGTGQNSPLSDMDEREGDPFSQMGDAFEEMDTDEIDPDSVWQELTSAESRGSISDQQQRIFAEVSKHSYCEACEYFTGPPDIECTHEGTEIIEFLDMETVRLVDCPIVAERRELEENE